MNSDLLDEITSGFRSLIKYTGHSLNQVSETASRFSAKVEISTDSFLEVVRTYQHISKLFELHFTLNIQQGEGVLELTEDGLLVNEWGEDVELTPPQLNSEAEDIYQDVATDLSNKTVNTPKLISSLKMLSSYGAQVEILLQITLEKKKIITALEIPDFAYSLIYIYSSKFKDEVNRANFIDFANLVMPENKPFLLVLFADVKGSCFGSNVAVLGIDYWISGINNLHIDDNAINRISEAISFRSDEVNWDGFYTHLTPHHLYIQRGSLSDPSITDALNLRLGIISVLYLANQVKASRENIVCHFKGYKKIAAAVSSTPGNSSSIYKLFSWGFDNLSSDKLGIIRHIITLRLSKDETQNFSDLLSSSEEILESAKNNFQTFIKQSVEFYFDSRIKINTYLQKFNEDIGSKITSLSSELIENLYKTVGIIVGAAIAIILDSRYTLNIISLVSLLYFLYILFIFLFVLSTTYFHFNTNIKEYQDSFDRFNDVFGKSEIEKLKGNTFNRAKWFFLLTYTCVSIVYGLLGSLAFYMALNAFRLI